MLPFTAIESFGLSANVSEFNGSWFVDSATPSSDFQRQYETRFHNKLTPGVGHAYDTVRMLAYSFSKSDWLNYFRQLQNYPGVTRTLSVEPNGIVWSEASVKEITDNEIRVIAP